MIRVTTTYKCRVCGSDNIVKNRKNKAGQAQYHCKACGAYRVLEPKAHDKGQRREQVLRSYRERASLRGLGRIYGVARQTVMDWIQAHLEHLPSLSDSLVAKQQGDVLELDALGVFVSDKAHEAWLWTALCRRTRQIVAFVIGDRRAATCQRLWQAVPPAYRRCRTSSDFWQAYQVILPKRTQPPVGKDTGQTPPQERWYLTLRQRVPRFVRKTLSFPYPRPFMNWSAAGLSFSTTCTSSHHLLLDHYPKIEQQGSIDSLGGNNVSRHQHAFHHEV